MEKGQLDGLRPKPQKRSLLRLLTLDRHTRVTAEWAELQQLSTVPPQPVYARVAQHFPAMGTLMRHARLGVPRTDQRAIGQYYRRCRAGDVEFRNGNGELSGFN